MLFQKHGLLLCLVKIMSLLKSSKTAIDPSQFLRFLKKVLVKSGKPHFNIFGQQDAAEILACILDELCDNEYSFTIFSASGTNAVQSSLELFLTPEHLLGDYSFFCNYCSSLQPAIIEHHFSRVGNPS